MRCELDAQASVRTLVIIGLLALLKLRGEQLRVVEYDAIKETIELVSVDGM